MKPLLLHLPDNLRDDLEDCLTQIVRNPRSGGSRQPAEHVARMVLSPAKGAYGDFPFQLANALGGLTTASGPQALMFDNLPPTQGDHFIRALMQIIHGDLRKTADGMVPPMRPSGRFDGIGFHQDAMYSPAQPTKMIRCLHCKTPGSKPDPTVFITADEVIHGMACERAGLAPETSAVPQASAKEYHAARDSVIAELQRVHAWTIDPYDDQAPSERQAFLQRNPNYDPTNGAPEFFVCSTPYDRKLMAEPQEPHAAFYAMSERLRSHWRAHSDASVKANTAVIWNDAGVLHDRAGAPQLDRELLSTGARPRTYGERFDPQIRLAGAPVCPVR